MDELKSLANVMSDRFFKERDKELLEKLKAEVTSAEARTALQAVCGIDDTAALDALIQEGIGPDTIAAVSIIPLVAVAWADREMEASERDAIAKAAVDAGISEDSASHALLKSWLAERPEDHLLDSWVLYVRSLKEKMDAAAVAQLKSSILTRAENVAAATGGYLGLGNKISATEKELLATLESAFN